MDRETLLTIVAICVAVLGIVVFIRNLILERRCRTVTKDCEYFAQHTQKQNDIIMVLHRMLQARGVTDTDINNELDDLRRRKGDEYE